MSQTKWRWKGICIGLIVCIVACVYNEWAGGDEEMEKKSRLQSEKYEEIEPVSKDGFWQEKLRKTEILYLRRYRQDDTAQKYKVYFKDGSFAVAKLVQDDNVFHFHFIDWEFLPPVRKLLSYIHASFLENGQSDSNQENSFYRAIDQPILQRANPYQYQGWPELVVFYADRLFETHKKPVSTGRWISNRLIREGTDFLSFLRWIFVNYLAPEYLTPVTLTIWIDGLVFRPPSLDAASNPDWLLHLSTVRVLSFLFDDHDQLKDKNWIAIQSNPTVFQPILWDSGLSFQHGPFALCHGLLAAKFVPNPPPCFFDRHLVSRLRYLMYGQSTSPLGVSFRTSPLVSLLHDAIASDPLSPLFCFGSYFSTTDPLRTEYQYPTLDFLIGLARRVDYFLSHVDHCIAQHGQSHSLVSRVA